MACTVLRASARLDGVVVPRTSVRLVAPAEYGRLAAAGADVVLALAVTPGGVPAADDQDEQDGQDRLDHGQAAARAARAGCVLRLFVGVFRVLRAGGVRAPPDICLLVSGGIR